MRQKPARIHGNARTNARSKDRPNILIIMGDDVGWFNLSAYNRGMMGYWTPHIDRIAREGVLFTDYYGQQSCAAGRAALITGQTPLRTGLSKVGIPGAKQGISDKDHAFAIAPAIALAKRFIASFQRFPPRNKPETLNLDTILQRMEQITLAG